MGESSRQQARAADLDEQLFGLYQSVASRAVTLTHALSLARDLPRRADFAESGLTPMARGVISAAREGNIQAAALQWRLVLEALDHAQTDRQSAQIPGAADAWIIIAAYYLSQRPDGRVLADSRRRGEEAAGRLLAAGRQPQAADLLHHVGLLLVDPYVERRDQWNFAAQTANWLAQGRDNALDLQLPGDLAMPAPPEALAAGAALLRRAADLRTGRERGHSLKALADALLWHSVAAGEEPDRDLITASMTEAWTLLDPKQDGMLLGMLAHNASALKIALPDRAVVLEPGAAEVARMQQDDPRAFIFSMTTSATRASDPRAAVAYLCRGLSLAKEMGDEEAMVDLMLRVAKQAERLFPPPAATSGTEPWTAAYQEIASRARAESWPNNDRALALLALALDTSKADREDAGIPLLVEAINLDVSEVPGLDLALSTALVQVSWHWGATHYKAERFLDACAQYLRVSGMAARLGLPGLTRRNFGRAMEAFNQVPSVGEMPLVAAAAQSLPHVQSEVPDLGDEIRRLWLLVISQAAFAIPRAEVVPLALQAAKGASLTVARGSHRHRPVLTRPAVEQALTNWRTASANAPDAPALEYDEERLLVAYADTLEQAGETPAEQLDNLARGLDRTLASELARGAIEELPPLTSLDGIRAKLPPDSVLVSIYPCFDENGKTAYVTLLATRDDVIVRRARGTTSFMDLAIDGLSANEISNAVAGVRADLLADRQDGDADARLEWAFGYTFGAIEDDLRVLHERGCRHLCVNPHGALHFCPLPLLGRGGVPIADDWIVTHMPSVGLLAAEPAAGAPRTGATAFALGFDDARTGLTPLPEAPEEARRIAQAVGGVARVDRDATVGRFDDALRSNRWVHVATHGRHDPRAPALQTLYLHSGRRRVVPYFAVDVLQHQLDGLDLVTLSACETALGRIDINDNPRGLQAFLFIAGAATIVSCLWPVRDAVAAMFFEQLYRALAAGRPKLQAFAAAQQAVRRQFPRRADWGTFHYSGRW